MSTTYNRNVDLLKGVAILLVVIGHSFYFSFVEHESAIAFIALASIHMPLFFVISGYLSGCKNPSTTNLTWIPKYIKSKVQKLLLPLLIIPILYALCMNANVEAARVYYLESIVPSTMHAGYWFTLALFQTFLFFLLFKVLVHLTIKLPFFSRKGENLFPELFWMIAIILLVRLFIAPSLLTSHERIYKMISFSKVDDLLPYFFIGYLLSKKEKYISLLKSSILVATAACLFFLFFYDKIAYDRWRYDYIITISGLIILYNIVTRLHFRDGKKTISPLFIYLGKNSLPIYLIHYFLLPELPMVKEFLDQIGNPNRIFLVETTLATLNALFVIGASLFITKAIRLNKYLAFLLLGDNLPRRERSKGNSQEEA